MSRAKRLAPFPAARDLAMALLSMDVPVLETLASIPPSSPLGGRLAGATNETAAAVIAGLKDLFAARVRARLVAVAWAGQAGCGRGAHERNAAERPGQAPAAAC
jgi:hypothetical protein